jgi:hypothetical protein
MQENGNSPQPTERLLQFASCKQRLEHRALIALKAIEHLTLQTGNVGQSACTSCPGSDEGADVTRAGRELGAETVREGDDVMSGHHATARQPASVD